MERNNDVQVIAWSEFTEPQSVYPTGIHGCLAEHLNSCQGITASVSGIEDPDQGVSEEQLESADVLMWFGHIKHGDVEDISVERIVKHVKENGLGFLGLHSTHFARPFKALMETECSFRAYVENGTKGDIKIVAPDHPIAEGVSDFTIPQVEWYGEPYAVPKAETVVLAGVYDNYTELTRDGLAWTVENGRVFYFRPGHETFPIYHMPEVKKIVENTVRWLAKAT